MKTEQEKDEQLIRWLEGDLSGAELAAFESSPEFNDYKKIVDASSDLTYPTMDEKAVFQNIQAQIADHKSQSNSENQVIQKKKKTAKVVSFNKWILAIASIAVLAFAVVTLLPNSTTIDSSIGQHVAHTLPDGSEINLNGNSTIEYKDNFAKNRVLELDGEAFFDVKKGDRFAVQTDEGTISVLGTSFNVFSRDDLFIVSCKSGKVKVESNSQSFILEKGDRVRILGGTSKGKEKIETNKIANWINGESYFSSGLLSEVVLSLSSIYEVNINLPSQYQNKKFTGSFIHNDLNKALKMVFSPMEISYSLSENGEVILGE